MRRYACLSSIKYHREMFSMHWTYGNHLPFLDLHYLLNHLISINLHLIWYSSFGSSFFIFIFIIFMIFMIHVSSSSNGCAKWPRCLVDLPPGKRVAVAKKGSITGSKKTRSWMDPKSLSHHLKMLTNPKSSNCHPRSSSRLSSGNKIPKYHSIESWLVDRDSSIGLWNNPKDIQYHIYWAV